MIKTQGKKKNSSRRKTQPQITLLASGDLREQANRVCWQAQQAMEEELSAVLRSLAARVTRAHAFDPARGHGFIGSQREGMQVFSRISPEARLIVAEAVWQYSHHVLHGLIGHRGPILTVANWSGQWPGLVGMLNLNGSLTKAGVTYSTLWSEDFQSSAFRRQLATWLNRGSVRHDCSHVQPLDDVRIPRNCEALGERLASQLRREKAIMGVFDEGCMGMYNAIVPDDLLHAVGVFKERLSQSALAYETSRVTDREAAAVFQWLVDAGMEFHFGKDERRDLTKRQVLQQCKMYVAAVRIADQFGCDCVGIQYQQGLKDVLPASDLVEGMLNNGRRPPVRAADSDRVLYPGRPLLHFNEVDECAGLDAILIERVHNALGQPVENTLHDLRWGDWDHSGTTQEYVWVFEISGSAPPAHFVGGWRGASGERQPPMYFRLGGSTLKGISKPGEIIWSRIYVADDALCLDIGRAEVVRLPLAETQRRWQATTPQWPIMHAVTYGVSRDQMMAKHQSNHVQVVYAKNEADADRCLLTRAAMARALGICVNICGCRKNGKSWATR
jgi:hypothetical protein